MENVKLFLIPLLNNTKLLVKSKKIFFVFTNNKKIFLGEIPTFGLAGNRQDGIDYSLIAEEYSSTAFNAQSNEQPTSSKTAKAEQQRRRYSDIDSDGEPIERKHRKKFVFLSYLNFFNIFF